VRLPDYLKVQSERGITRPSLRHPIRRFRWRRRYGNVPGVVAVTITADTSGIRQEIIAHEEQRNKLMRMSR
jgi:hypothetical protein